jgi:hypothetical protein
MTIGSDRLHRRRCIGFRIAFIFGILLAEGERWIAAERPDSVERARAALAECRAGLFAESEGVGPGTSL